MEKHSKDTSEEPSEFLGAGWFDPIEAAIRDRVRGFIEELVDAELDEALGRSRYDRPSPTEAAGGTAGYRHGRRDRQLLGSFGPVKTPAKAFRDRISKHTMKKNRTDLKTAA